ncbi:MAG TPA: phytanoyl-CoA dioxygenase family protein [Rhizomicrobium sp.]|jgi:ectoine hydroxylase-related dioxygenase (phytanoyl-CoA dioxygenase family)|nr:phytanoyl-CoA dioxygenase family protein [Rhizomicrobium sp.]
MSAKAQLRVSGAVMPDEVAQFQENGFVILKGLLRSDQMTRLKGAMRTALETFENSAQGYDVTELAEQLFGEGDKPTKMHQTDKRFQALSSAVKSSSMPRLTDKETKGQPKGHFLVDTGVWRRVPALADFALYSELPQVAAALLGVDSVRYYDDQIFIKEPGAADRAAFHQDLPYFNLDGDRGCVFWIPLDTVRRGSGAMGYVPGSHRWGDKYNPNIFMSRTALPGSQGEDLPDVDSNPEAFNVVYADVDPGDVVVHHFLTVHGSEGNTGSTIRRAFSLRYCDAELRYHKRPGAPSQPLHRLGTQEGDRLDDTFHPQVWPRRKVEAA